MLGEENMMEDYILGLSPNLLNALLKDQTMSKGSDQRNIFWATSDYKSLGSGYEYDSPIIPELITGQNGKVIMARIFKESHTQRGRSRDMAEVFTPSWVCNKQNNLIDEAWFGRKDVFNQENSDNTWTANPEKITFPKGKTWYDYVRDTRLEITCGEAPYLVSRYDTTTGNKIPIKSRIGLLDRKLRVIGENTDSTRIWLKWARVAFQNVYGYEWQGDSLLIARENLLMTFIEYFHEKFGKTPALNSLRCIVEIISWNLWQMDGLTGTIPNTSNLSPCNDFSSGDLFVEDVDYCIIRDWKAKPVKETRFIDLIKH